MLTQYSPSMISDKLESDTALSKPGEDWTSGDNAALVTVEQPANLQKRKHTDLHQDQSTWKCDTCAHRNFASASECFKCKTSQEVQLKRKKENPNNWRCGGCGNSNWPQRTVCNRCKAPKPGFESQLRNGDCDWTCLNCDNINRPFRQQCNKCKMSKAEAVNPRTGQLRSNTDWMCMSCGNSNYPYRIACNKCKLPKHQAMTATRSFNSDQPENWLCFNCDNVNLPFRTECNKCKIEKREGVNPETAFKRTNRDWKCTVCENVNFYYRVFCNKCQLPKSEIGEEVATQLSNDLKYSPYPSYKEAPHSSVPLPSELQGVPTEPIEQAAAQMFQQQVEKGGARTGRENFTVDQELLSNRTDNWTCYNCDNLNYPLRTQCNKCSMSKAEAIAPETHAGRLAAGDSQWQCSACSNNNYHFRLHCNKCKAERPPRQAAAQLYHNGGYTNSSYTSTNSSFCTSNSSYPVQQYSTSYAAQQYAGGSVAAQQYTGAQDGGVSWICTGCENVNWPRRTACNKCGADKSAQSPNWLCSQCKHINYSFVTECSSCHVPQVS